MSSETPQEKLNLCTRCRQRPFVYGNEKDGMCEMCFAIRKAEITPPNAQQQQAAGLANSPNLNARQKAALKRRAPKPQPICEENWGGPCRGGCGKYNQGEYFCYDCRTKQAEKNFMIQPGQVELVRHAVGKVEDKIVKQVVVTDASSIEMEEMLWLWPNRIDLPTDQLHQATLNARNALFEKCVETHKHAVDVLLPYCEEIIRRYKMQGVAAKDRPNGKPTVDAYFKSIGLNYNNVRSWIHRKKLQTEMFQCKEQKGGGKKNETVPSLTALESRLLGTASAGHDLVKAIKHGGNVDGAIKDFEDHAPTPERIDEYIERPVEVVTTKLEELAIRLCKLIDGNDPAKEQEIMVLARKLLSMAQPTTVPQVLSEEKKRHHRDARKKVLFRPDKIVFSAPQPNIAVERRAQ